MFSYVMLAGGACSRKIFLPGERQGFGEANLEVLIKTKRLQAEEDPEQSALIIESQRVKTLETGLERGGDDHKQYL